MGWICSRYKENCYWYELVYIEVRFLSVFVGWCSSQRLGNAQLQHPDSTLESLIGSWGVSLTQTDINGTVVYADEAGAVRTGPDGRFGLPGDINRQTLISGLDAALITLVATVAMTALQLSRKPFEEDEEEAAGGWRTSPNRQADIAYLCQLIVIGSGFGSSEDTHALVFGTVVVALFLPLVMAVYLSTVTAVEMVEMVEMVKGDGDEDGEDNRDTADDQDMGNLVNAPTPADDDGDADMVHLLYLKPAFIRARN